MLVAAPMTRYLPIVDLTNGYYYFLYRSAGEDARAPCLACKVIYILCKDQIMTIFFAICFFLRIFVPFFIHNNK